MSDCLEAFEKWFTANGGWLHTHLQTARSVERGVHVRVKKDGFLSEGSRICACPPSLSLSYLNAVAAASNNEEHGSAWAALAASLPREPVGWFFLVHEYLDPSSFWRPYLDILPKVDAVEGLGTAMYFDDEDRKWVFGTNLWGATDQRLRAWEEYWRDGSGVLKKHGIPAERYTWELFKWAATIFTSRSFTSQWLVGDYDEGDHMQNPDHSSDPKTFDVSIRTPSPKSTVAIVKLPKWTSPFQVLFPALDTFNHNHSMEITWSFDQGAFAVTAEETSSAGEEVFNNYGRKSNEELLMGYGFCLLDNPWDRFTLLLRPPAPAVQAKLKEPHPELFESGEWNMSAGRFCLQAPKYQEARYHHPRFPFWDSLPWALVELLFHMIMHERRRELAYGDLEQHFVSNRACADIFAVSRHMLEQLHASLNRMHDEENTPLRGPRNKLQQNAQIYRDGQIRILQSVIAEFRHFFSSILLSARNIPANPTKDHCSTLLTLPEALEIWARAYPSAHRDFLNGIAQSSNASDVHILQQAGWEDDIWTLWLCWLIIIHTTDEAREKATTESGDENSRALINGWVDGFREHYLADALRRVREGILRSACPRTRFEALRDVDLGSDMTIAQTAMADLQDHLDDLWRIVQAAATAAPDSIWAHPMWSEDLIAVWGLRVLKYECIDQSLLTNGPDSSDEFQGLLMYLHRPDGNHVWVEDK
ncbi:MAG: hypothetical protein M1820_000280 [Bogoriella megaspora]|nr:MAG: hypothetical protein M1820_000280 [Bogoriella megaspora]